MSLAVSGVPIGWLDAGATHSFDGFAQGVYDFGSIRPLGAVVGRARRIDIPAELEICDGRCRDPAGSGLGAGARGVEE